MVGGEIDRNALIESFARIKEDITKLRLEIENLKKENYILKEKLSEKVSQEEKILKKINNNDAIFINNHEILSENKENFSNQIENNKIMSNNPNKYNELNLEVIKIIVKEAVESALKKEKKNNKFIEKINKKRKNIIINRILSLAEKKNYSTSDIKEIIVDQENLCSKATFYRYIEKLKKKQLIDFIKIDEEEIVAKIN
ncbi:MAG: hypothetical protein QXE31_00365 [Candidatus Woesearchaeota archaeon]